MTSKPCSATEQGKKGGERMRMREFYFRSPVPAKAWEKYREHLKGEVLAEMQGKDGFPAAEYERVLLRSRSGLLFVVSYEEDWNDIVNEEGNVEYEPWYIAKAEKVSPEEAKELLWDKVYTDFSR